MQFYRKHKRIIKVSGVVVFTTGVGWIVGHIVKTYRSLHNVLDTSIIDFMEPTKFVDSPQDTDEDFIVINWIKSYDNLEATPKSGWNSLKFAFARRLLNLTDSENKNVRRRALKQLSEISTLDNWHYSLLAHSINARTAVGLARIECVDSRLFLKPPFKYLTYDHNMLVNSMKDLLTLLNEMSKHSCMNYFINKAFAEPHDAVRFHDHDSDSAQLLKLIQTADDILPLCLESLLHHSSLKDYAKDIVLFNGLPLLMEIYNRFKDNLEVNITLCSILANISAYPELLEDIFKSGWISVLAEWMKSSDIRISAAAAKTLANFDNDDKYKVTYPNGIYVLHPFYHCDQNIKADVVFVHGLLGGVFFTWRQRNLNETTAGFLGKKKKGKDTFLADTPNKLIQSSDPAMQEYLEDLQEQQQIEWDRLGHDFEFVLNDVPENTNEAATGPYSCFGNQQYINQSTFYTYCWPKDWLSKDCKNLRILGINYDTNISMWAPMCPAEHMIKTLQERSDDFINKLLKAGIGQRPIIWVTHSMGGLLVKNILCKAWASDSEELRNVCLNTKGIVFYSTPHVGSRLANISQPTALLLWPSVEVQELKEDSPALLEIQQQFLDITKRVPIKVISFVETKSTLVTAMKFNFLLVEPHSANPSVGEIFHVPQDHLGICKPANRSSFLYQKVLTLIKEVISQGLS